MGRYSRRAAPGKFSDGSADLFLMSHCEHHGPDASGTDYRPLPADGERDLGRFPRRVISMKAAMWLLTLGVFPAFGGSRVAPVRLYIHFQQDPPDAVLEAIQEELSNIMVPAGMEFDWRSLNDTKGNEVS